ncbi:hypothetical protein H4R34_001725 [Dimargaris verticillata]|uniref:xanthine dehydrogenase n=1 Tax=Dimargaris verticillata TaxID=2761393 RepID=A0A9W8EE83_9FUNG|nr:hypothetical protein H4R34_001725 [Dimargaris verticillata]
MLKPAKTNDTHQLPSSSQLFLYVNTTPYELSNPAPNTTLLQFLRDQGLTGTKLGCAEGGCGACTVVVARYDPVIRQVEHWSTNACLQPLCSLDGCQVITIEGIGTVHQPHPVQERLALLHGSQCGFCTPGIAMSLYALLRNNPTPTLYEVEDGFDGNLCRCTGYRPILDAAKTFAQPSSMASSEPVASPACQHQAGGHPCRPNDQTGTTGCGRASGCHTLVDIEDLSPVHPLQGRTFEPYNPTNELAFPLELTQYAERYHTQLTAPELRVYRGDQGLVFYRPATLAQLLEIKHRHPTCKLLSGNTEVGIETKFKGQPYPIRAYVGAIPQLQEVNFSDTGLTVGANLTLTKLESVLKEAMDTLDASTTAVFQALLTNLAWFAGRQIRNVATLAGNIATASPISDLNPVLVAGNATLTVQSHADGTRSIPMREFFLGYRKTALKPDEVLVAVHLPYSEPNQHVQAFKQAKRKDDDIAIANAGLSVHLRPGSTSGQWVVQAACLAFGGMGPTTIQAKATAEWLVGQTWNDSGTLDGLVRACRQELQLDYAVPGGMAEYRTALAMSFAFKFWHIITDGLVKTNGATAPHPMADIPREPSQGMQYYQMAQSPQQIVGQALPHLSALKQVTGQARYVDDIPKYQGELYGALVLAQHARAKIISIDASALQTIKGVVGFYTHKDVPGSNLFGPVVQDEVIFAEEDINFSGQIIGIVAAHDQTIAQRAAKAVVVQYDVLDPILTIGDAITHQSFFGDAKVLERGDIAEGFRQADHIFEGEYRVGGQEHFYLETQATLVVPKGEDDEYDVYSSTQNPTEAQHFVASVLGVPFNRVVCHVKRLGGAFGGKESRACPLTCSLAVASYHTRRPIRCMLDRDEDMMISGQRHSFLGRWKVGVTKAGKILALDIELYNNGGHSQDLSVSVMERAITHVDNVYYIPHFRAIGRVCRTNIHSNTAFRGFGGPQGMFMTESWIREVADRLQMPVETLQTLNFYQQGQTTPYNQPLTDWHFKATWDQVWHSAQYQARRQAIDAFNRTSRWKKRGLAIVPTKFGISFTERFLNQAAALVHIYTDGSVLLTHGGTEMGQGLHTKMVQICAEELGVPVDQVYINETASNTVINASPTAASASSDMNGMAVLDACNQLNARLAPIRDRLPPGASLTAVAKAAYFDRINLTANGFYKTPDIGFDWATKTGQMFFYFTVGTAISEVELDVLTGDHVVRRTDIAMDVGRSLNPAIDVGQIEGAFVQGMGWCTLEETLFFPNGSLFTRGPGNYKIPGFRDTPRDFRVQILRNLTYTHLKTIRGSKGIGEPPLFLGSAVLFALRDAIKAARADHNIETPIRLHSPATAELLRLACQDPIVQACAVKPQAKAKAWALRV